MEEQTYMVGPVVPVGKKKDRKHAADALAKQLMKLLAEGYDVIQITGYRFGDDDE